MFASQGCVRRAFTLEGRGIWHAASISLAQQVWGPLRARLDTRLALDMTSQVIRPLNPKLSTLNPKPPAHDLLWAPMRHTKMKPLKDRPKLRVGVLPVAGGEQRAADAEEHRGRRALAAAGHAGDGVGPRPGAPQDPGQRARLRLVLADAPRGHARAAPILSLGTREASAVPEAKGGSLHRTRPALLE